MDETREGQWRASDRVQHWRPRAKTTEDEARMQLVYVYLKTISTADYDRQNSRQTTTDVMHGG